MSVSTKLLENYLEYQQTRLERSFSAPALSNRLARPIKKPTCKTDLSEWIQTSQVIWAARTFLSLHRYKGLLASGLKKESIRFKLDWRGSSVQSISHKDQVQVDLPSYGGLVSSDA